MLKLIPIVVLSALILNEDVCCINALSHLSFRYNRRGHAYTRRTAPTSIAFASAAASDIDTSIDIPTESLTSNNNNNNNNNCDDDESGENVELEFMCLKALQPKRPPIILLHGLLGQKRNFVTLGSTLACNLDYTRDIYAVDLRNHGDNNHNDWRQSMTYSDMANDVIGFMDQHSIQEAVLVGHSMGGKLAASISLSHSNRVAGLIVLDIAPVQYTLKDDAWREVQDIVDTLGAVDLKRNGGMTKKDLEIDLRDRVDDPSIREYIVGAVENVRDVHVNIAVTTEEEKEQHNQLRWRINVPAIIDQMEVLAGFDIHGIGNGYGCHNEDICIDMQQEVHMKVQYDGDALFINSPSSNYIRGSHMPIIQRYFPNFMVSTIRGVGHTMHHEDPEATVALMKKYLDR